MSVGDDFVTQFGSELKRLRMERGWRQRDLVDALEGEMARSTLANVEAGRERPTERLWTLLSRHLPMWREDLEPHYASARLDAVGRGGVSWSAVGDKPGVPAYPVGGPFQLESVQFVYTFRHSRSPEEIIEVRRVRALRTGANEYGLRFTATGTDDFKVEEEALWGGYLASQQYLTTGEDIHYLRQFRFGRKLRRGQTHDFALRSWVERDPHPDTRVTFSSTLPTESASIHLNFTGPERPGQLWCWGPVPLEDLTEEATIASGRPLELSASGNISAHFSRVVQGSHYGISWEW